MRCLCMHGSDRCLLKEGHSERHLADWGGVSLRWDDSSEFCWWPASAS
jgi:hypothetical protein